MLDLQPGISAVLVLEQVPTNLEDTLLDLAAVLDGLASETFEILLAPVCLAAPLAECAANAHARRPHLPLRLLDQQRDSHAALSSGVESSRYDLVFATASDGEYEMSELNHLLEAIEHGADLAIGYRPQRLDGMLGRLQRWTWHLAVNLVVGKTARDVECQFKLFRRVVWERAKPRSYGRMFNARLLRAARRHGFIVAEVPIRHHRRRATSYQAGEPIKGSVAVERSIAG